MATMTETGYRVNQVTYSGADKLFGATVRLVDSEGSKTEDSGSGPSPIEAVVIAINRIVGRSPYRVTYKIPEECPVVGPFKFLVSVTERDGGQTYVDFGYDDDTVVAFIKGYVGAVNTMIAGSKK